jgi:hypothetical protein
LHKIKILVRARARPWAASLRRPLVQKTPCAASFQFEAATTSKTVSTENQTEAKPRQRLKTLTAVDKQEWFYKIQYHEQRIKGCK